MSTALAESLQKCTIEGNTLYLPDISTGPLENYGEVRKALLNAGAKYKRNTFVFPSDAQPFVQRLIGGESVNIKKEFQFFPTPPEIADWLVELADLEENHTILEPSAGQGAIISAIHRKFPVLHVDCFELMEENAAILNKIENCLILDYDFLNTAYEGDGIDEYDRVIANPPFSKNQDIDHIRKMYDCTREGGRIVSIASKHWQISSNKKETEFRDWLFEVGAQVIPIEAGSFKASGTMVQTCVVIIDK